jgi:16S rRNA G966 N2-methylase RsmD
MTTATDYRIERYSAIDVCWLPDLDGGGRGFGQDYLPLVRQLFGRVGRVYELCSGPGFIGFSLLAHGLCDSLALADVNPNAVAALRETVRRNGLADRVSVYQSDGLTDIPRDEQWDLVVGNPPHFAKPFYVNRKSLITDDLQWRLHRGFYRDVAGHLTDGGSVLLQENSKGSTPDDFLPMLDAGGLDHVRTVWYSANGQSCFYYLWAKKAADGLVFEPAATATADIELIEPASAARIERAGVLRLRLRNRLGRTVRPLLVTAEWTDALAPVKPGAVLELPLLAFKPGDYAVDDRSSGARLASVTIG